MTNSIYKAGLKTKRENKQEVIVAMVKTKAEHHFPIQSLFSFCEFSRYELAYYCVEGIGLQSQHPTNKQWQ